MVCVPGEIPSAFEAAWNAHDMVALAELFHDDATFVNRYAAYSKGAREIVESHRIIHETIYSDSLLTVDPPEVRPLSVHVSILHFWTRLSAGEAHPRGRHQVDTLILAVVSCREGDWRIQAAENVTLTDPRTGQEILRTGLR
jgi:uncharacterized protein (TIGR02246 family)